MRLFLISIFLVSFFAGFSQLKVSGRVFDISKSIPLPSVSVLTTSGHGTVTDSLGFYTIEVTGTDSIYFSYLNKPTTRFPVRAIPNFYSFDISLHVPVAELPAVKVGLPNYRRDSLQNRRDYEKVFNFRKPGISVATSPQGSGGAGVGLDLDEFINIFRFRRNRSMMAFRKRLEQEEIDKFWEKLSEGGEKQRCGWLKDKFGVSWQIVPTVLGQLLQDKDAEKSKRVMNAMLQMDKLDIASLKRANDQQ